MIANLIHAAIVEKSWTSAGMDYVSPRYVEPVLSADATLIRALLVGSRNPRVEQAAYASLDIRRAMLRSQLRQVADIFGIEGGHSIPLLVSELTQLYFPVVDDGIVLSPAATKTKTYLYTYHELEINVAGGEAVVQDRGFGTVSGPLNTPLQIPGLSANATVRVVGEEPLRFARWATAPTRSFGHISADLKSMGLQAIKTLSFVPGVLSEETRRMLAEVVAADTVDVEVVIAATLILTNVVASSQ